MSRTYLTAKVGLDSRTAGAEAVYSYLAPAEASVGQAWMVPLGPRRVLGYVLEIEELPEENLPAPLEKMKAIDQRVEGLDLPPETTRLVLMTAAECLVPPSLTIGLACPPGIRGRMMTVWTATDAEAADDLTTSQKETLRVLETQKQIKDQASSPLARGAKSTLRALERRGLVEKRVTVRPPAERNRSSRLLRLNPDSQKVDQFLAGKGKTRPAQAMTLLRMQGSESAAFSTQEVKALGGVADTTIKALIDAGLLVEVDPVLATPAAKPPTPNPAQQEAIDQIVKSISDRKADRYLLYGVTGSGKTEVFLRAAGEALKWGRQVLYLVPEIALTAQVIAQLRERFGSRVAVLHSNMTPVERLESWMRVQSGEAPVVLGPRSALFAPLSQLGLIILDEEHEASYKQENNPRYNTKRMAALLAKEFECPVVMGSATPSLESFEQARSGELKLLTLPSRAAAATMPDVLIEDMTEGFKSGAPSLFSPTLQALLKETYQSGKQSILFLNRRAYSPFVMCRDCGHKLECETCAVSLAYHRAESLLRCHHCDRKMNVPNICPVCEGERMKPFGMGAERVHEEVQQLLPQAAIARLDRDIARKKGALEEILTRFRGGQTDVLVGTQMVAKGLDFPNVTLVGVIAADISLNIPDFRASERTFQLLSQVAGRAGRGDHHGRVVIQTFNPLHPAVLAAKDHDYEEFFDYEIEQRKLAVYPPFWRLVNILCTGKDREAVMRLSAAAAQKLRVEVTNGDVLGPAFCPIERIKGSWRRHIMIKLPLGADVEPIRGAVEGLKEKDARLAIDVDPYTLS